MHTGISTACLYPARIEDSLQTLLDLGFQRFEFFINTFSELDAAFLRGMARSLRAYGATAKSVHPFTSGYESFLLFSGYERRFEDSVEFYKRYFEAAGLLGASILVLHGQRMEKSGDMDARAYYEHYHRLYEVGQRFGVTVAQENVNLFRSSAPAFLAEMRRYLHNECAFVLDIKQAVCAGQDPFVTCAAMGTNLVHVHINDHAPGESCLLPGRGVTDYGRLMQQLAALHYPGDLIIEVYRQNFQGKAELVAAKGYVESLQKQFESLLNLSQGLASTR